MSDVFDKLLASRPVNKQAARVLGGGVHYEPNKAITERHWSAPPPLEKITPLLRANTQFTDVTGVSFGRMKVVGYLGRLSSKKKATAMWLVRCVCGDFESRSTRSVLNPKNDGDRCGNCRHLAYLKRAEAYRRNPTAPQPDTMDL